MYFRSMILSVGMLITIPTLAGMNLGRPGELIHLVIGYQPYYTLVWSAIVNKHQGFWKKYLPMGSMVEFQPALFGPPIVQAMVEENNTSVIWEIGLPLQQPLGFSLHEVG